MNILLEIQGSSTTERLGNSAIEDLSEQCDLGIALEWVTIATKNEVGILTYGGIRMRPDSGGIRIEIGAEIGTGTEPENTFASKVAACQDKYADASVGNVTGSNAVNVFLGIGVAWTVAAFYHWTKGRKFEVQPGNLAFSVTMFCSEAVLAVLVLVLRRRKSIGGELGGPKNIKILTSAFFFSLWLVYLTLSSLEAYDVIPGF
ncbi:hypothetical protein EVAR_10705_1 [Eumeta japonica]|uniref:Sodium/calcium exchanger membrane region domain-containing protein n=1 Tax=Eumeta variegata TaxID=151549 RepID=A0A4C1U746_EUMVA|nr:hypothetical protein EVAR_10705_1 [Eumeta japonica]